MNKFKVGDKVRVRPGEGGGFTFLKSKKIFTVKGINGCNGRFLNLINDPSVGREYYASRFEKVKGVGKMKVNEIKCFNWLILEDSCGNYKSNFNCPEAKALSQLKDCGVGFSIYKLSKTAFAHNELNVVKTRVAIKTKSKKRTFKLKKSKKKGLK